MRLKTSGGEYKVGQLGPDFIYIRPSVDLPPCEAEMSLSVDGRERKWRVSLPEGASKGVAKTPTKPILPL